MQKRFLGQSNLEIQPIILGAWAIGGWFWGGTDDDDAVDAIRASVDAGITAIDTAPMYGRGHSEEVVGRAVEGRRDQVVLMTKVGLRWDDERGDKFFDSSSPTGEPISVYRNLRKDSIRTEVERSLKRLRTDYIDLLQCHWPDPTTPVEESMEAMAQLVREGTVRAIGVSNFNTDLLARSAKALGDIPLASTQPHYSLLTRKIEHKILPWCHKHNVGVIAYSPMERGLLTGKITPERVFPESDGRSGDPLFKVENRKRVLAALDKAREVADAHHCTLAQLSVAWVFHQPGMTASIVGARTRQQAEENAKAAQLKLNPTEVHMLGELFAEVDIDRQR